MTRWNRFDEWMNRLSTTGTVIQLFGTAVLALFALIVTLQAREGGAASLLPSGSTVWLTVGVWALACVGGVLVVLGRRAGSRDNWYDLYEAMRASVVRYPELADGMLDLIRETPVSTPSRGLMQKVVVSWKGPALYDEFLTRTKSVNKKLSRKEFEEISFLYALAVAEIITFHTIVTAYLEEGGSQAESQRRRLEVFDRIYFPFREEIDTIQRRIGVRQEIGRP